MCPFGCTCLNRSRSSNFSMRATGPMGGNILSCNPHTCIDGTVINELYRYWCVVARDGKPDIMIAKRNDSSSLIGVEVLFRKEHSKDVTMAP